MELSSPEERWPQGMRRQSAPARSAVERRGRATLSLCGNFGPVVMKLLPVLASQRASSCQPGRNDSSSLQNAFW
jgi:hypothetical protein